MSPQYMTAVISGTLAREMTRTASAANAWTRQKHRAEVLLTPPPCYRSSPVLEVRRMYANSTRYNPELFRGDTKWCGSCKSYLPFDRFGKDSKKRNGLSSHCTRCKWQRNKGRRQYAVPATNCYYCGCTLDDVSATIDHVVPRSAGGSDDLNNLVAACITCNTTKNNRSIEEYRVLLERKRDGVPYFTKKQLSYLKSAGFEFPIPEDRVRFWFEEQS